MKKIILIVIAVFSSGCATSSLQTGPTYKDWETGQNKFDAKIVLADTGFFTPSSADAIILECVPPEPFIATDVATGERHVTPNDLEGEELLAVSRCQLQTGIAHDTQTGAAASFVAPVLNSAAMVGGAYFIGKGIGNSGDRTSNTNNSKSESDADAHARAKAEADAHAEADSYARGGDGGDGGDGGYASSTGDHSNNHYENNIDNHKYSLPQ